MGELSLRDNLFLLSHDDAGKLVIPEAHAGAGLAGATLIELLLTHRVAVIDGRLDVLDDAPTGDEETDATIDAIGANTAPCGPRAWVSWISYGAYRRVAGTLVEAGMVRHSSARRLGLRLLPVERYLPADPDDLVRVRAHLRYAVHGREAPDPVTAALCGLVHALRLESALLLTMPTDDLLAALERLAGGSVVTVRQVTRAVVAVITAGLYR